MDGNICLGFANEEDTCDIHRKAFHAAPSPTNPHVASDVAHGASNGAQPLVTWQDIYWLPLFRELARRRWVHTVRAVSCLGLL
jgi:hypothetical protein